MLVDLISATNDDGIRLDVAFFAPSIDTEPIGPVDAILLIHGSRGNFSDPNTREMAEELRMMGYACLALNTTAHDTVWFNLSNGVNYGNAYEIIDDTCRDLKAGVDYLWDAGYRRIALLGHSMGAVRVAYYAATQADQRLAAVIPISPVTTARPGHKPMPAAARRGQSKSSPGSARRPQATSAWPSTWRAGMGWRAVMSRHRSITAAICASGKAR